MSTWNYKMSFWKLKKIENYCIQGVQYIMYVFWNPINWKQKEIFNFCKKIVEVQAWRFYVMLWQQSMVTMETKNIYEGAFRNLVLYFTNNLILDNLISIVHCNYYVIKAFHSIEIEFIGFPKSLGQKYQKIEKPWLFQWSPF